jgi:hypothetical protein
MSAFLCSDVHTVTVAAALCGAGIVEAGIVETAQALRDANNRALAARYRDTPEPLGSLRAILRDLATPDSLKADRVNGLARCFRYQCAEGDVLETHPMASKLAQLIESTGGEVKSPAVWEI